MNKETHVYILSDSIGETAEMVVKAGLTQFKVNNHYIFHRTSHVQSYTSIDEVMQAAQKEQSIIAFTLIDPCLRSYLNSQAQKKGIQVIDIMGPVLKKMEEAFDQEPYLEARSDVLDEAYFERIEAIEFAVKNDDGKNPCGLTEADLVLIGVSRTSKTPLSQYLALKRFKVANLPIVPEVKPPEELFRIDPKKCIALSITPEKLNAIRKARLKSLGLGDDAIYANVDRIHEELSCFETLVDEIGCHVIDVSNKAVEETAHLILEITNPSRDS